MHVDVIHELGTLTRFKDDWEAVHDADPDPHFYLSWTWFSAWLRKFRNDWFVLAAKPSAASEHYVAFFPLKVSAKADKDGTFHNEIEMGGFPRADYNGIICRPEFDAQAIPAFADALQKLNWSKLNLEMIRAPEERLRLLLKSFNKGKFAVDDQTRVTKENIDNNLYPFIDLPRDWEAYLETKLSSNTRQKARRFLKKVDAGEFRITHSDKATFTRDLDVLLKFWEQKWGNRKGDRLSQILASNRVMLTTLFEADAVMLPVFWKGETALCVHAMIADHKRKVLYFVMGGRDEDFNSPPPGFILHAHTIRWAIQNGFVSYDFLMGNEAYKYMFGAEDRLVKCLVVSTRTGQNLGEKLDKRGLDWCFDRAKESQDKGKTAEAERGYRQILDTDPRHGRTLNAMAAIATGKGALAEAAKFLKAFLAEQPMHHAAWLKLGKALQAQADSEGAIRAFKKVLEIDPKNAEAPPLLAELSPVTDRLRTIVGAGPAWARTDEGADDLLKKLRRK